MSSKTTLVVLILDIALGIALLLLRLTHMHLTVPTKGGSAIVPASLVDTAILPAMGAATAWLIFGRGSTHSA
jgi:hypothetical protein